MNQKKTDEPLPQIAVTSSYYVNKNEYKKMQELNSTTVKLSGDNAIGIKVECLVENKWVDITDYNCW